MRYYVLATDYDGTIASHGKVDNRTIEALKACKESGRKIILVTGRELKDLKNVFPEFELFDLIVAENGALIFDPATRKEVLLGERPPQNFIDELIQKNVTPLSIGKVIVATWEPNESIVLQAIHNAHIEYQLIFNKGAVMVLPPGINKAFGLQAALDYLQISAHNTVAIGDAENDQAMFRIAECSAAVANSLDSIKKEATIVTTGDHGSGVSELISSLIKNDLSFAAPLIKKGKLLIGKREDEEFFLDAYRNGILIAGTSGGGKTTLTTTFIEALVETNYQFCLVDPEGDYTDFPDAVVIGDSNHVPVIEEAMKMLTNSYQNVIICLLGIPFEKRPYFFNEFITKYTGLKNKKGHPHWLIVDEGYQVLPANMEQTILNLPATMKCFLIISTTANNLNGTIFKHIDTVFAIGDEPGQLLSDFAVRKGTNNKFSSVKPLPKGKVWMWEVSKPDPFIIETKKPKHLNKRHIGKYATGDMKYNAFVFKGPENKMNLRATNALMFAQMADGLDDETWNYHLKRHDYSKWFANSLHDDELAELAKEVENSDTTPDDSKEKIVSMIKATYSA